jgi:hypothetical protein
MCVTTVRQLTFTLWHGAAALLGTQSTMPTVSIGSGKYTVRSANVLEERFLLHIRCSYECVFECINLRTFRTNLNCRVQCATALLNTAVYRTHQRSYANLRMAAFYYTCTNLLPPKQVLYH